MKRAGLLILVVFGILAPLIFYMGWSLGTLYGWVIVVALLALVLSFPFIRTAPSLTQIIFLAMGFLSYLMVFVVLKDLLGLAGVTINAGWVYLLSLLAVVTGSFIAHRGPRVVNLKLPVSDLPEDLEGFRIIQISDLHVGPTIGKKYVESLIDKVNTLQPHIVCLTGDIGDGPVERYREDISPFARLKTKFGVFYVPGNHEYYWNANEWMNVMNNLKAIVLLNRGKKIHVNKTEVLVAGVSDPVGYPKPDPYAGMQAGEDSHYKILLSHRPGIAPEAAKLGYDLQLSGHTHGGQFFPWTIVVRFAHKYVLGHYRVGQMWLNVNSGTGSWGPFLRLGTTSEITQIELHRSNKSLE